MCFLHIFTPEKVRFNRFVFTDRAVTPHLLRHLQSRTGSARSGSILNDA
jgi:hypothetical protein